MTATAPAKTPGPSDGEVQDAGHVDVLIVGAGVSGIGAMTEHAQEAELLPNDDLDDGSLVYR